MSQSIKAHVFAVCVSLLMLVFGTPAEAACPAGLCTPTDAATFQANMTSTAACGDVIKMPDGAVFVGNFEYVRTCWPGHDVTIIRSGMPQTPCLFLMKSCRENWPLNNGTPPIIRSANTMPALGVGLRAAYVRFLGIRFDTPNTAVDFLPRTLVIVGYPMTGQAPKASEADTPDHVDFLGNMFMGTPTGDLTYGMNFNATNSVIANNYFDEIHAVGQESKCFFIWDTNGPVQVENNYCAAAGINAMVGGTDTRFPNVVPEVHFLRNYFTKKLTWWKKCVTGKEEGCEGKVYAGIAWSVKNLLEWKNCLNCTAISNVFEYSWAESQGGTAIVTNVWNQNGTCPHCTIKGGRIAHNLIRHAATCWGAGGNGNGLATTGDTIVFEDNTCHDIHGLTFDVPGTPDGNQHGYFTQLSQGFKNVTARHNTVDNDGRGILMASPDGKGGFEQLLNLNISDNLFKSWTWTFALNGDGDGVNMASLVSYASAGYTFLKNAIFTNLSQMPLPPTTIVAALADFAPQFVNQAAQDYRLAPGSVYHNAASDGTDVGARLCSGESPDPTGINAFITCGATPPPPPPPPPVPTLKTCTDEGTTYAIGQRVMKRTTRGKEAAFTLEMQVRGWVAEVTNKVQKNNVDVTFRCDGV